MRITIQFSEEEEKVLQRIVEVKKTSISNYIRVAVNEKIEEEIDKELFKKAMKIKDDENSEFINWDDALKELESKSEL